MTDIAAAKYLIVFPFLHYKKANWIIYSVPQWSKSSNVENMPIIATTTNVVVVATSVITAIPKGW
jgi:hypothetical protein